MRLILIMDNDEKKYEKLIEDLKNLPRIDAPENFSADLRRKINSLGKSEKQSFWDKLISPARLAPAAITIVTAIIIFYITDINSNEIEDPLNIEPKLRDDLLVYEHKKDLPVLPPSESLEKSKGLSGSKNQINSELQKKQRQDYREKTVIVEEEKGMIKEERKLRDELSMAKSDSDIFSADKSESLGTNEPRIEAAPSVQGLSRENLNFMQRNLSSEDKMEVQQLKDKIQTLKSLKTGQK